MPIEFASRSIPGSTAVITGAASGMGQPTTLLFASWGAHAIPVDGGMAIFHVSPWSRREWSSCRM